MNLPEYKWHNGLQASEIHSADIFDGEAHILTDAGLLKMPVSWYEKHQPKAGMILVYTDDKGLHCIDHPVGYSK